MYEAYRGTEFIAEHGERDKLLADLKTNHAAGTYIIKKVMGELHLEERPAKLVANFDSYGKRTR